MLTEKNTPENETVDKGSIFLNVNDLRMYTMIFVLVAVVIFFQIVVPDGIFLGARNLSNLFRQLTITGIITVGMMLLIVSCNFDLAVGSAVALVGGLMAQLQANYGVSTLYVIPIGLVCGVLLGSWQGFWVAYRRVPSFIVTLGNMMLFRGIYLTYTKGITVSPMNDDFAAIMTTYLPNIVGIIIGVIAAVIVVFLFLAKRNSSKKFNLKVEKLWLTCLKVLGVWALIALFVLRMNEFEGIPLSVMILIAIVLLFVFITKKTRFARRVYAIGGNNEAARLAGINVKRYVFSLYVITGVLCSISAVLLTSRLNAAVAAAGTSYEMDVISACVVGGTSLSGGKGTVLGVIIGALLISCLGNGMSLLNVESYVQSIVKGLVLILAVWFDVATQSKAR